MRWSARPWPLPSKTQKPTKSIKEPGKRAEGRSPASLPGALLGFACRRAARGRWAAAAQAVVVGVVDPEVVVLGVAAAVFVLVSWAGVLMTTGGWSV